MRVRGEGMSDSLIQHAKREFRAAGFIDGDGKYCDEMQELICTQVIELLKLFGEHGHSGSSAPYAINLFKTLAAYEPIVPLTGEDWEWFDHGDGHMQNIRCGHVFKQPDRFNGQAYDLDAVVFYDIIKDPETGEEFKSHYTNRDSMQPITFPYTPKREYRETPKE
jgi:hypothetical protein